MLRAFIWAVCLSTLIACTTASLRLSGCENFESDDLTNRVSKKRTLSSITKLFDRARVLGPGQPCEDLTFRGFNINLRPLEDFGRLAARNGQVVNDLLNSKTSRFLKNNTNWPVGTNVNSSLLGRNGGCRTEANPFATGNPVFGSLTQATVLSNRRIFAAGGCWGLNSAGLSECFYRYTDFATNATAVDYGAFPVSPNQWFTLPRGIVEQINHTLVVTGSTRNTLVPVKTKQVTYDGRQFNRLTVGYSTRLWTDPYFDCLLGQIWMITYSAPVFYVADNGQVHSVGMTGVDINLSDIDLNECSPDDDEFHETSALDSFRNTHLCEEVSTVCRTAAGRGFNFGSYQCHCRRGFYRRSANGSELATAQQFYEGSIVDIATLTVRSASQCSCNDTAACARAAAEIRAILQARFACLPCPEGCDSCVTGTELCTHRDSVGLVVPLTVLSLLSLVMLVVLVGFVFVNRETRVIRSASWPFLITTLFGAILAIIGTSINAFAGGVTKLELSDASCALWPWFQYIGFGLTYGSILVKTWRLHQIFSTKRFRGKGRRSLSNADLAVMLLIILAAVSVLLLFWTVGQRSVVETLSLSSGLKYRRCSTSFVNDVMSGLSLVFLLPVVYLSFQLRNITDDFSETKEISVSVYIFLVVKLIAIVATHIFTFTPDLHYLLAFLDVHLSFTLLIVVFFLKKIRKIVGGGSDEGAQNAFILNKKRQPNHGKGVSVVTLEDAHRRQSTCSMDGANSAALASLTGDGRKTLPSTGESDVPMEPVNYLPSLTEDKASMPASIVVNTASPIVEVKTGLADNASGGSGLRLSDANSHSTLGDTGSMSEARLV